MNLAVGDPNIIISDPQIQDFINMINFAHKSVQFEGIVCIRKLLSLENNNASIQKVMDSGIVPKLWEIMTWEDETQFQIESSWCVLNICGGEAKFSDYIVQLGGLDILISLFSSPIDEIVDNAIWAIANIAGTSSEFRDMCLQKACMEKLLQALERFPTSQNITGRVLYVICTFCRKKPYPQWQKILPALYTFLSEVHSHKALALALRVLSFISGFILWLPIFLKNKLGQNVQEIIKQGFIPFLIDYLSETDLSLLTPALATLGNLVAEEDEQADEVLSFPEFLPKIFDLTKRDELDIQREVFTIIRNIAAGTSKHIERILENNNYIATIKAAVICEDLIIAEEAAWTICNMIDGADSDQVDRIVKKHGLLESFTHILTESAGNLKEEALEAILTVLESRDGDDSEAKYFTKKIQKAGLVEIIRDLARGCDGLRSEAVEILKYFPVIENSKGAGSQRGKKQKIKPKSNRGSGKPKKSIGHVLFNGR